jgi:flagellar hook-length control protein FliK
VQVSVLAREGIQQAELHLHPADMGPISVLIALDGSNARVDFGADSPATRSLIESGLPELAAALRDAGFTLSGGGVSQHARQQPNQEAPEAQSAGTRTTPAALGEAGPVRMTARMGQGAVDLYA